MHAGVGTGKHDSSVSEKLTSSAEGALPIRPEAMSWRTSLGVIAHAAPPTRRHPVASPIVPSCRALSAALTMIPAMPEPRPVASDEQLTDGIATVTFDEKFVQPLNCRYERGAGVNVSSYCVTELTTITWG